MGSLWRLNPFLFLILLTGLLAWGCASQPVPVEGRAGAAAETVAAKAPGGGMPSGPAETMRVPSATAAQGSQEAADDAAAARRVPPDGPAVPPALAIAALDAGPAPPSPEPSPPPGQAGAAPPAGDTVEFNFDDAELNEVIRTLADILKIQYIAEADLQGKVTIHTWRGVSRGELFPVFFKILEVNGLTAVQDGPVYRITAMGNASRLPLGLTAKAAKAAVGMGGHGQAVIQVIPLKNILPSEMARVIAPFVSEGATVVAHEGSKILVVVDRPENIGKILRLIPAFDVHLLARASHRFYFLEHSVAADTAALLGEIFQASAGPQDPVRFIPLERLNAVLAIGTDPQAFASIDGMVSQLDGAGRGTAPRISVYFVRNGTAADLAQLLNQVFLGVPGQPAEGRESSRDRKADRFSRNPFAREDKPAIRALEPQPAEPPKPPPLAAASTAELPQGLGARAPVAIIPDTIRNALIIQATPQDLAEIEDILSRLDVLPRQVLIEATIAEIGLDSKTELGVEWRYLRTNDFGNTELVRGTISGADGLSYAIEFSNDVLHTLDALAQKNRVNILSSPHVLASDNKEARIDVSNEIPIISSETTVTSSAEPIITTDIQYRDTGVLLSVTPHINDNGLVTMEIYQEVSEQADNVEVAGTSYPSFFKRAVDTTLTVKHGQTIVLGGLIRENKANNRSGVPYLMDVPVLGYLFGFASDSVSKTELIILLTPRVINSLDDVAAVSEEFERKVGNAMGGMGRKP